MEIISTIALITINETLIVQAVSFLIFLFILNRVMIAPLRTAMAERDEYIYKLQLDVTTAHEKMDELTHQINTQEKAVKKEAFEQSHLLEAAGGRAAADILDSTRQTIATQKEKAQKEIDAQIAAVAASIQAEAEALSGRVMEKILNRELT